MRLYWPRFDEMCAQTICPLLEEQSVVDIRTLGIIERVRLVLHIMETEISCLIAAAGYRTRDRNRKVDIGRENKNNWFQLVITPP